MPRKQMKPPEPSPDGDAHLELVQQGGLEQMFQRSRQRVHQLTTEKGFPEPYGTMPSGRVWLRSEIEAWYEANRHRFRDPVGATYSRKKRSEPSKSAAPSKKAARKKPSN